MMTLTKLAVSAALIFSISACAASVEKNEIDGTYVKVETKITETKTVDTKIADTKTHRHIATVKPGADVSLNTAFPRLMTSGTFQAVELEFSEGYADGVLSVEIVPTDGLSLFGGADSKTFNMADAGPHMWDVDVKADADGVYFLNVFVKAKGQGRSFSVRLNMGTVSQKMFDDAMPTDGELADGGKIRVLDAEETIQ